MPRAKHDPTPQQRQMVGVAKAAGLTHQQIADLISIDEKTLVKHYGAELKQAHSKAVVNIANNLYKRACGDSKEAVTAAIFWLKTRGGWKETQAIEHSSPDGTMSPKGFTAAEYAEAQAKLKTELPDLD